MWYNGISDQKSLFSQGCFKAVHSPVKLLSFSWSQFPRQLKVRKLGSRILPTRPFCRNLMSIQKANRTRFSSQQTQQMSQNCISPTVVGGCLTPRGCQHPNPQNLLTYSLTWETELHRCMKDLAMGRLPQTIQEAPV